MDTFKRAVSVVTIVAFVFTLCPVSSALALRTTEIKETREARGLGEAIQSSANVEASAMGKIGKPVLIVAIAAVLLTIGHYSTAPRQPVIGTPDKVQPAQVEVRPSEKMMPYPTTELMRKVQDTARIIKQIDGGVFSVMFWDTANVDPDKDFRTIAEFGFNEVIMDGYNYVKGNVDDAAMVEIVLQAHEAGIQSLKFIMGDPSWPYDKRQDAISATTKLCEKLAALKRSLQEQGYSEAASLIKGVAINNEPHDYKEWNFDLGPYCSLHDELEKIADRYDLTYQRVEAFWYTQHNVESGEELRNYRPDDDPFYNMSYRNTADGTYTMAGFSAKNRHVIGFDMVTYGPTGYKGQANNLPEQLLVATQRSYEQRRATYDGTFVHFATIQDVRDVLNGWRTAMPSQEQVSPATPEREVAPSTQKQPSAQEQPSAPASEKVSIRVANHEKLDERTTAFEIEVSGLTDAQRSSLAVIALKHTDAYYPQPTVESIFDIPPDGKVRIKIPAREYQGKVLYGEMTFCVVKRDEYRQAEFFRGLGEIRGKVAQQGTDVRASLPDPTDTEKMLAFNDMLAAGAQRQALIAKAVEEAPIVTLTSNGLVRLAKKSMMAQVQAGDSKFKEAASLLAQADIKDRLAAQYENGIFGDEGEDGPAKGQQEITALRKEAEKDRLAARSLRAGVMLTMVQGEQRAVAGLISGVKLRLASLQARYDSLQRSTDPNLKMSIDPKAKYNRYAVPQFKKAKRELASRKQELAFLEQRNEQLFDSAAGLEEIVLAAAAGKSVLLIGNLGDLEGFVRGTAEPRNVEKIDVLPLTEVTYDIVGKYDFVVKKTPTGYQLVTSAGAMPVDYTDNEVERLKNDISSEMGTWA